MITLACDTSTLLGSVAVLYNNELLSYIESLRQGSHAEALSRHVEQALVEAQIKLSDVDLFVTGCGPGSFTGIRISLNTVKTYSYIHNKKCLGIDSLENLAYQGATELKNNTEIVAMINAYKNMIYIATYQKQDKGLVCIKNPDVIRVQNISAYLGQDIYVVGDGFSTYKEYLLKTCSQKIIQLNQEITYPNAKTAAHLAFQKKQFAQHWSNLIPLYLRESEAEENVKGIKFEPLF